MGEKEKHQNDSTKFPLPLFIEVDINLKFSFSTFISNSFTDILPNTFFFMRRSPGRERRINKHPACFTSQYNTDNFLDCPYKFMTAQYFIVVYFSKLFLW